VNRDAIVDAHMKYLEEEIEVRIESMKIELDGMLMSFKKELNSIKKDIIEYINKINNKINRKLILFLRTQNSVFIGRHEKEFENNLKELRQDIKK
jgi:hypothetical protein